MNNWNFDGNVSKTCRKTWNSLEKPGKCWKQRIQTQTWRCGFVFFYSTVCQQKPLGLFHFNTCSKYLSPSVCVTVDWDYVASQESKSHIIKPFACFHAPCPCRDCRSCSMTCGFTNWPCARTVHGWEVNQVTRSQVGGDAYIHGIWWLGNHSYLTKAF